MRREYRDERRDEVVGALLITAVVIVILIALTGCASANAGQVAEPPYAGTSLGKQRATDALDLGSLRLVGRFSAAHACVIGPRLALTNGHVIDQRPFDESVKPFPYAWSDGTGASGFLVPASLERARDLATVEPLRQGEVFPYPLRVAERAPVAGDRVWLLGFDWRDRKRAMADDVIEARVTRVVALHVIFSPSGQPGSSGSCLVNDAGEVVAINEGGYETDASALPLSVLLRLYAGRARPKSKDTEAGLAIGVWGELWKMPQDVPSSPPVEPFPQPRPLTDGPPKE